jgi:uncharacterized protein (TIGR03437 family)
VKVPASVVASPGQWSIEFQVDSVAPSTNESATITAQLGSDIVTEILQIHASQPPFLNVPRHLFATPGTEVRFQASSSYGDATFSAASLPTGASLDPVTGTFDWVPSADQKGIYDISFIAARSQGNETMERVKLDVGSGAPAITRVTNGASHSEAAACSSGAVATLDGGWLAQDSAVSDPSGNSFQLSGTTVRINGSTVPVLYASPTRVDFQCPVSAPGSTLSIVVETPKGTSPPIEAVSQSLTPAIFSTDESGAGQGIVMHAGNAALAMVRNYRYAAQPARVGDHLVVYATGLNNLMLQAFVKIDGVEITADSITLVPGQAGVWQVSFTLSQHFAPGGDLVLSLTGLLWNGTAVSSNNTTIAIEN